MRRWAMRRQGAVWLFAVAGLVGALSLAGCGKQPGPPDQGEKPPEGAPVAAAPGGETAGGPAGAEQDPPPRDGRHEPFAKATRGGDDPPPESNPPPDRTVSGKPV